jgi:hypothetical protein
MTASTYGLSAIGEKVAADVVRRAGEHRAKALEKQVLLQKKLLRLEKRRTGR